MDQHRRPDYRTFIAPGEPLDSAKWRTTIIQRCRWFADEIWQFWQHRYQSQGYREANLWLTRLHSRLKLGNTGLYIDATDEDIASYARIKTKAFELDMTEAGRRLDKKTAIWTIKTLYERTGFSLPLEDKHWKDSYNGSKVVAALARIKDPLWFARELRKVATRALEQIARELSIVNRSHQAYISQFTLQRMLWRKKANRELLEKLVAVNNLGEQFSLAALSDLGVSNPVIRRMELMTRLDGFEQWATNDSRDWKAMLYTITTPSKYHACRMYGKHAVPNSNYIGATPQEAQQYLNKLWQRARAELKRKGIETFGFRVAEPHHDGTPHWHLLLFVEDHKEATLTEVLGSYAMAEDGDEPGADKHRFEAITIDPTKGRATGYIAKYISKNIDGYKVDIDEESQQNTSIAAIRAACWASVWGIRQFQQIGGPPVGVWRELRRTTKEELESQCADSPEAIEHLEALRTHANEGNWQAFIEGMGGATVLRADLPLRAFYFLLPEEGKYGEDIQQLKGIYSLDGLNILTRLREWRITLSCSQGRAADAPTRERREGCAPLEFCQ